MCGGRPEAVSFDKSLHWLWTNEQQRFPYVSHMVLNAGVGSFTGINWWGAAYEICTGFKTAVTAPGYKIQATGEMSGDGLGWVWQCNIFGHYVLVSTFIGFDRGKGIKSD